MKNLIIKLSAIFALVVCSCNLSYAKTSARAYNEMQTRVLEPEQSCIVRPLTADLKLLFRTRTVFVAHYQVFPGNFDVEIYTNMATSAASREYEADVFVAPLWEAETYDDGKMIKVTITGYPARYVDFRASTPADEYYIK